MRGAGAEFRDTAAVTGMTGLRGPEAQGISDVAGEDPVTEGG